MLRETSLKEVDAKFSRLVMEAGFSMKALRRSFQHQVPSEKFSHFSCMSGRRNKPECS